MKKRLRKKKHIGEFQQLGFNVKFDLDVVWSNKGDQLWMDFLLDEIIDLAESRKLLIGGGLCPKGSSFYVTSEKRSATDEDREALREWLSDVDGVENVQVFELSDAWYGPWDF